MRRRWEEIQEFQGGDEYAKLYDLLTRENIQQVVIEKMGETFFSLKLLEHEVFSTFNRFGITECFNTFNGNQMCRNIQRLGVFSEFQSKRLKAMGKSNIGLG